ncbi:MAG TPA: hypothetical protein QGF05_04225 [Dehalococcoidia bacterium]|nr:hypothetical protein [Dehalococcoidia bacterium]
MPPEFSEDAEDQDGAGDEPEVESTGDPLLDELLEEFPDDPLLDEFREE